MATSQDFTGLIGTLNALMQTLNQNYSQQHQYHSENNQNNKKWHEDVMKYSETFDGEDFSTWHYKLKSLVSTYYGTDFMKYLEKLAVKEDEVTEIDCDEDKKDAYLDNFQKVFLSSCCKNQWSSTHCCI